ncbi:TonB-dependent receptor domain-containing protein [Novosphingobium colocasiae]
MEGGSGRADLWHLRARQQVGRSQPDAASRQHHRSDGSPGKRWISFELGLKSQFLDRRATFNAAAFWTEISDYQTAITDVDPANTAVVRQYIANIPKVRSRGVEGDFRFAPSDAFSVYASASYTDAKYVTYTNAPVAPELHGILANNLSGEQLPGVPKFAYSLGADASAPLVNLGGKEVGVYAHADWSWRGHFNTSSSNSAWAEVASFGLLNARVGLKTDDGLWDVSLWAKKICSTRTISSRCRLPRRAS